MTDFKDLSQAHTIVYLKKYNSKIPTLTPSLLNQNIESLSTIYRLQENKMLQKTATTGRQPVRFRLTLVFENTDISLISVIPFYIKDSSDTYPM